MRKHKYVCTQYDIIELTFLGSSTGGLVQTLSTLITASHPGQVDSPAVQTLLPTKRVHSKVLIAGAALLAPFEDLGPAEWTRLLLGSAAQRNGSNTK